MEFESTFGNCSFTAVNEGYMQWFEDILNYSNDFGGGCICDGCIKIKKMGETL